MPGEDDLRRLMEGGFIASNVEQLPVHAEVIVFVGAPLPVVRTSEEVTQVKRLAPVGAAEERPSKRQR